MGKTTKRFKPFIEENEGIRHKKLNKESRHNFRDHLRDVIENEDWDALEEETYEAEHSHNRW